MLTPQSFPNCQQQFDFRNPVRFRLIQYSVHRGTHRFDVSASAAAVDAAERDYSADEDRNPLTPVGGRLSSKVDTHAMVGRRRLIIDAFKRPCGKPSFDPTEINENQVSIPIVEGRVTPHISALRFEFQLPVMKNQTTHPKWKRRAQAADESTEPIQTTKG